MELNLIVSIVVALQSCLDCSEETPDAGAGAGAGASFQVVETSECNLDTTTEVAVSPATCVQIDHLTNAAESDDPDCDAYASEAYVDVEIAIPVTTEPEQDDETNTTTVQVSPDAEAAVDTALLDAFAALGIVTNNTVVPVLGNTSEVQDAGYVVNFTFPLLNALDEQSAAALAVSAAVEAIQAQLAGTTTITTTSTSTTTTSSTTTVVDDALTYTIVSVVVAVVVVVIVVVVVVVVCKSKRLVKLTRSKTVAKLNSKGRHMQGPQSRSSHLDVGDEGQETKSGKSRKSGKGGKSGKTSEGARFTSKAIISKASKKERVHPNKTTVTPFASSQQRRQSVKRQVSTVHNVAPRSSWLVGQVDGELLSIIKSDSTKSDATDATDATDPAETKGEPGHWSDSDHEEEKEWKDPEAPDNTREGGQQSQDQAHQTKEQGEPVIPTNRAPRDSQPLAAAESDLSNAPLLADEHADPEEQFFSASTTKTMKVAPDGLQRAGTALSVQSAHSEYAVAAIEEDEQHDC